jgi:hypothetical protein
METLDQHIKNNIDELNSSLISKQRRRHLEDELQSLIDYRNNHPNIINLPSALELYCDKNPEAKECKIYEI